jgi:predicted metal-dependent hydrolase
VLDYLAAHEVAHLAEMNHSPRFWRVVERLYPNMARAKSWLDVHGMDLHRYGEQGSGGGSPPSDEPTSELRR